MVGRSLPSLESQINTFTFIPNPRHFYQRKCSFGIPSWRASALRCCVLCVAALALRVKIKVLRCGPCSEKVVGLIYKPICVPDGLPNSNSNSYCTRFTSPAPCAGFSLSLSFSLTPPSVSPSNVDRFLPPVYLK